MRPILVALCLMVGCARSFTVDPRADAAPADATADAAPDAGADGGVDLPDAPWPSLDAGGQGRRWVNRDDTRQCLTRLDLVLEDGWPAEGESVEPRADVTGMTVTPLVLPPRAPGLRPRLAFTTHLTEPLSETPHPTGRMIAERDGVLRILDLSTREVWSSDPVALPFLTQSATPAAGDVDGDGELELVVLGATAGLYVFNDRGELEARVLDTPPRPPPLRHVRHPISVSGSPLIADLEGDGRMEIVVGSCVLDGATLARRFCGPLEAGFGRHQYFGPLSTVYDIDGDGELEILAGRAAFEPDGRMIWDAEVRAGDDGFAVAGELIASHPGPEVALVSETFVYTLAATTGRLLHVARMHTGVAVGPAPIFGGLAPPAFQGGPPLLVDVDLDGTMEIGVSGAYRYQLIEPEDPSPIQSVRWSASVTDLSGMSGAMATDLTGDGYPEIVHQGEQRLRVFDARTGQTRFSVRSASGTRVEYPVIADVDADGSSEIVVPTIGGLRIYGERDDGFTAQPEPWLQHAGPRGDGARAVTSVGPGAAGGSPDHRPDAWIAWVEARCTRGIGEVRVAIRNLGGETIEGGGELGLAASSWPPERLARRPFDGPIAPGEEIVVTLPFEPRIGTHDYHVGLGPVDDECNTANNDLALPDLRCE